MRLHNRVLKSNSTNKKYILDMVFWGQKKKTMEAACKPGNKNVPTAIPAATISVQSVQETTR